MKSSKKVLLGLEVLEERLAPNGAFRGGIDAGVPVYPAINGLTVNAPNFSQPPIAFRTSFADFQNAPLGVPSFQSQLQSFQAAQAAQMAMIDQFFSELGSILQNLHLNTVLVL